MRASHPPEPACGAGETLCLPRPVDFERVPPPGTAPGLPGFQPGVRLLHQGGEWLPGDESNVHPPVSETGLRYRYGVPGSGGAKGCRPPTSCSTGRRADLLHHGTGIRPFGSLISLRAGRPGFAPGPSVLETEMILFHHRPVDGAGGVAPPTHPWEGCALLLRHAPGWRCFWYAFSPWLWPESRIKNREWTSPRSPPGGQGGLPLDSRMPLNDCYSWSAQRGSHPRPELGRLALSCLSYGRLAPRGGSRGTAFPAGGTHPSPVLAFRPDCQGAVKTDPHRSSARPRVLPLERAEPKQKTPRPFPGAGFRFFRSGFTSWRLHPAPGPGLSGLALKVRIATFADP